MPAFNRHEEHFGVRDKMHVFNMLLTTQYSEDYVGPLILIKIDTLIKIDIVIKVEILIKTDKLEKT